MAYVLALDTANRFLAAWANRDGEVGMARVDESRVRDFVVGLSTPHHAAFEVRPDRSEGRDRYRFPVVLYMTADGGPDEAMGYVGTLEVVREDGKWRVDELPKTYDTAVE